VDIRKSNIPVPETVLEDYYAFQTAQLSRAKQWPVLAILSGDFRMPAQLGLFCSLCFAQIRAVRLSEPYEHKLQNRPNEQRAEYLQFSDNTASPPPNWINPYRRLSRPWNAGAADKQVRVRVGSRATPFSSIGSTTVVDRLARCYAWNISRWSPWLLSKHCPSGIKSLHEGAWTPKNCLNRH